jgi:anti-anti-sigma regulatory factor
LPALRLELTGQVVGDATQALVGLEAVGRGGSRVVVACAGLVRVDFSAAGSILNWVATRQAEGCMVQFRDVHRLVAAFFNVIGINEHARVLPRQI